MKMEEKIYSNNKSKEESVKEGFGLGKIHGSWWWGIASVAQIGLGIRSLKKGVGDSNFMPLKAFSVASLFVGSAATASFATLRAFDIHTVEDMKQVGSSIRAAIRAPPRKPAE